MARIRSIKPEFWSSEQVMECSPNARLLFIGLWNFCDDGGNHVMSLKTIKAEILPGDDVDSANVRRMLDELSVNGLIEFYTAENKEFLHITGWKHQKIDQPTYRHPLPDGTIRENVRRTFGERSPPEGSGVEGSGREGKGEDQNQERGAQRVSAARGTRLPPDWKPSEEDLRWAKTARPEINPDTEAARFADYWHGAAGAKGVKADWPATWRNWIRRADPPRGSGPPRPSGAPDAWGNGPSPAAMRRLG